jgi:hypothetical protein
LCWIEQKPLYDSFTFVQSAWNANQAKKLAHSLNRIPALLCPSGTQEYTTATAEYYNNTAPYTAHYCGIMGPYGANPVTNQAYSCDANVESQGPTGREGLMPLVQAVAFRDITDGLSNTYLFGEFSWKDSTYLRAWIRGFAVVRNSSTSFAYAPGDLVQSQSAKTIRYPLNSKKGAYNDTAFGSQHPGGALFGIADGSVKFVSETVLMDVYLAMASRGGGETKAE